MTSVNYSSDISQLRPPGEYARIDHDVVQARRTA